MLSVDVNPDIKDYESKIMGVITKRQLVCLLIGLAIGIPLFFIIPIEDTVTRVFVSLLGALPAIICGWWKFYGLPVEEYISVYYNTKIKSPAKRTYVREPDPFGITDYKQTNPKKKVVRSQDYVGQK